MSYLDPCYGHGACNDGMDGDGKCICESGTTGFDCQTCLNTRKSGKDCKNG